MAAELTAVDLDVGEDWEAAEAVQDALLDHFGEWMVAGERRGVGWAVAETLRFKVGIDGHLGWWRRLDLAEILTELFPRAVSADEANIALVVPTLRDFLNWLELTGLLDPDSDPLWALHDELDPLGTQADQRVRTDRPGYEEFGRQKFLATAPAAYAGLVRDIVTQSNRLASLRTITCPTLVIVGAQDESFMLDAHAMAHLVVPVGPGHRELHIGGGHADEERPDGVSQNVRVGSVSAPGLRTKPRRFRGTLAMHNGDPCRPPRAFREGVLPQHGNPKIKQSEEHQQKHGERNGTFHRHGGSAGRLLSGCAVLHGTPSFIDTVAS